MAPKARLLTSIHRGVNDRPNDQMIAAVCIILFTLHRVPATVYRMPDEQKPIPRLEIGHVLFIDIVGYSEAAREPAKRVTARAERSRQRDEPVPRV